MLGGLGELGGVLMVIMENLTCVNIVIINIEHNHHYHDLLLWAREVSRLEARVNIRMKIMKKTDI